MRYEHVGAASVTQISAEIGPSDLVIPIFDSTNWPVGTVGPFWVAINKGLPIEEKILCSGRSGLNLQVFTDVGGNYRGKDGTVPQTHPINSTIEHIWTATEADEYSVHLNTMTGAHGYPDPMTVLTTESDIPQSQVVGLDTSLDGKADIIGDTFTGVVHVVSATGIGSHSARETFISTADPTPADGVDGDMWVKFNP